MSIGFVLHWKDGVDRVGRRLPGIGTNNVAEWTAILEGLKQAQSRGCREVEVLGDSQLVVRQFSGEYAVKAAHLKPLVAEARALARGFGKVQVRWIPREENGAANGLAQGALGVR